MRSACARAKNGLKRLAGDEEAVDKFAGTVPGAYGAERPQVGHEVSSQFCGKGPKVFIPDNVQTEIPGFLALPRQILPVDDFKAAANQMRFVIVHGFQLNEHTLLDGLYESARFRGRE